jgi:signal transduction histidine kinase
MATTSLDPRQFERLLAVGSALVSMHDPEVVLREVLEAGRELTGARYAALGILDDEKRELARFLTVGIDDELRQRIGPLPRGHGILGVLIREPQPLRLARISDHPRSYGFPAEHPPMDTFLGVPVMIRGEVFGNLYLTEKAGGEEFDGQDEKLLVVLAEWAAIAIDNARSHEMSRRRQEELERAMRGLEATVSLNREVGGKTDLPRVLELVVKRGRALVDARRCAVLLLDDAGDFNVAQVAGELEQNLVGQTLPAQDSPATDVLRAGRSQGISGRAVGRFAELGSEATSGLLIPLQSRGVDLGVLAVFDRLGSEAAFNADDILALESFCTSAATAIAATQAIEDEKRRLSIASSERERERWARELHDETLQELGALKVMQQSALQVDDPAVMRRSLTHANEQVERVIAGLQGLITELRPAALDQLGPAAAVEALVDRVSSRSGLVIDLDVDLAYEAGREPTRHTAELEATVYRTVQEALTNVVKHADARSVRVLIEERDSTLTVTVEDDGRGFDERAEHDGFGLLGMRERVALAGGELSISSPQGGGTRVRATLPVTRLSA